MNTAVCSTIVGSALACALLATPARAQSAPAAAQPVDRTVPTFSSISDGQPGSPGQLGLNALGSVSAGDWQGQASLQYTGKGKFGSNSTFTLTLPTVNAGEGIQDAETSATFAWQQRWFGTDTSKVTFSTSAAVQVPIHEPGQGTDFIGTASLNVLLGQGVGILNAYVETQSGQGNPAPTEWGVIAGYKRPLNQTFALIGDVVYSSGNNLQFEASLQINATSALTLGPGIFLATTLGDNSSDVTLGAGLVAGWSF